MTQVGISDISKNPSLFDKLDDLAEVVNKKTKQVKGVFIPTMYLASFEKVFEEIEYQKFLQRNRSLQKIIQEDQTLTDGLDDAY